MELDGRWYHVDTTWADRESQNWTDYTYFLIHDDDFQGGRSGFWNPYEDKTGGRYRYYIEYDSKGLLGENEEEIRAVIGRQYSNFKKDVNFAPLEILTPPEYSRSFLDAKIREVTGEEISTYTTETYREYRLHKYVISAKKNREAQHTVEVLRMEAAEMGEHDRVSPVLIQLDQAVELATGNVFVKMQGQSSWRK